MVIKVTDYVPSTSRLVMAFVDITLDGWLQFNGLALLRDGGLKSSQLRFDHNGTRTYVPAVVVLDDDLRELLTEEILAAIHAHMETLPLEKRMRPPRPPTPQPHKSSAIADDLPVARSVPPPRHAAPPHQSATNGKKPLAPPRRLSIR